MRIERLGGLLAVAIATVMWRAEAQQGVAPPTPGGFAPHGVGSGVGVGGATVAPGQVTNPAGIVRGLHLKIQALIRAQRYNEAEAATMELLQREQNTQSQYAQVYLRQIQAGRAALEAPLRQIIVPEVNFREANIADVVKFLGDVSVERSANKRGISFVLQLPPGVPTSTVTLNLRQTPLLDVLRYAASGAGLEFRCEQHAVVIYKPQPAAPAATQGGAQPPPAP